MSVPPPDSPQPPPAQSAATASVADVVAQTLHAYGVRFAFGLPGNDVLETVRACAEQGIEFVLVKAEPSAAFMADAVWQLSGAPAALVPALGPGISNAVSGIAGALMERTAMIVLSGEMGTPNLGVYPQSFSPKTIDHLPQVFRDILLLDVQRRLGSRRHERRYRGFVPRDGAEGGHHHQ
jgi:acetolactate synthase-1/2/3 large subunit